MTSVAELLSLYQRWGGHGYDEDLPQSEHALQTAAHAEAAGASEAVVAAALLHDIGHLLALDGQSQPDGHEQTGAAYLARLFPPEVTVPVALHVRAKRYLCAVDRGYAATLSAGSTTSLRRQGGPLSRAEVADFETTPGWTEAVALRRWDDAGKAAVSSPRAIDSYEALLMRVAARRGYAHQ
jgi:predicted HD phosphohydrolase